MASFDRSYDLLLVCRCFLVSFSSYSTLNNIVTLKSFKVIENGITRKLGYGFLSNYGSMLHRFRDKAIYWLKIAIL